MNKKNFAFKLESIKRDLHVNYQVYEVLSTPIISTKNIDLTEYFFELKVIESHILLKETFEYISSFQKCKICINVNKAMLTHYWLFSYLLKGLHSLKLSNELTFALEINERCAGFITHHKNKNLISQIRARGIEIWLDDFGCGNANFSVLNCAIFEVIKIDKSVFWQLFKQSSALLIELMNYIQYTLNLGVVIEGVETEEQLHFTYQYGGMAQGYIFR